MPLRCESPVTICFRTPAAQCIICGRHFCGQHGEPEASVCRLCRGTYRRKLHDEAAQVAEVERRELAAVRNNDSLCGWYECPHELYALCERCGASYCPRHVSRYKYSYRYRTRRGIYRRQAEVTLCDACKPYLDDYKTEKSWRD